jgi:hypothetical protein
VKRTTLVACASALALALAPTGAFASDGGPVGSALDQVQQAANTNSTSQSADSSATTKQANVNAPISVLSKGSNNGDVHQSNDATTISKSENNNQTKQSNDQQQHGSVEREHGDCGHRDHEHGDCGHRDHDRRDCGKDHKRCHEHRDCEERCAPDCGPRDGGDC